MRTQDASGALVKEITRGAYAHGAGGLGIRMVRDGVRRYFYALCVLGEPKSDIVSYRNDW